MLKKSAYNSGVLAQLARAPALHAGGQGFDSLRLHHFFKMTTIKLYELL